MGSMRKYIKTSLILLMAFYITAGCNSATVRAPSPVYDPVDIMPSPSELVDVNIFFDATPSMLGLPRLGNPPLMLKPLSFWKGALRHAGLKCTKHFISLE